MEENNSPGTHWHEPRQEDDNSNWRIPDSQLWSNKWHAPKVNTETQRRENPLINRWTRISAYINHKSPYIHDDISSLHLTSEEEMILRNLGIITLIDLLDVIEKDFLELRYMKIERRIIYKSAESLLNLGILNSNPFNEF